MWFISGASKGLGRAFAEHALENGYRVVATARKPSKMEDMNNKFSKKQVLVHAMDVTDESSISTAVTAAMEHFGRIDALISNAGYNLIGPVEETTDKNIRTLFNINFFGSVALIRKVLPIMRAQKCGNIVQISSVHGTTTTAGYGAYSATKCGLDGLFEALKEEVAPFGIRVMTVKPGAFKTDVLAPGGNLTFTESIGVYDEHFVKLRHTELHGQQQGDPRRAAAAINQALRSERPPLRLFLGSDCVEAALSALTGQLNELQEWRALARSTDFPSQSGQEEQGKG